MARITYKSIVTAMIEKDSQNWVERLLEKNNIEFKWTETRITELEYNNHDYLYGCNVKIVLPNYKRVVLEIGGAVDDILGISHSVIWSEDRNQIIWMNQKKTREQLGIEEFKIA